MDYQNRPGSKIGGGGLASDAQSNYDRRERLRKLALETIDLSRDPYFLKVRVVTGADCAVLTMALAHVVRTTSVLLSAGCA